MKSLRVFIAVLLLTSFFCWMFGRDIYQSGYRDAMLDYGWAWKKEYE